MAGTSAGPTSRESKYRHRGIHSEPRSIEAVAEAIGRRAMQSRCEQQRAVLLAALLAAVLPLANCGGGSGNSGSGSGGGGGSGPAPLYAIGGTVTGTNGAVLLQDNGGDDLFASNGSFTFPTSL